MNSNEIKVGTVVRLNPWTTGVVEAIGPVEARVRDARGNVQRVELRWLVTDDGDNVRI